MTEDKKTPEEQAKAKFNELKEKIYGVDGFFNKTGLSENRVTGFCVIRGLKDAVQANFNVDYLIQVFKALEMLSESGIQYVTVTLGKDAPIIFGSKTCGYAIAPKVDLDDEE